MGCELGCVSFGYSRCTIDPWFWLASSAASKSTYLIVMIFLLSWSSSPKAAATLVIWYCKPNLSNSASIGSGGSLSALKARLSRSTTSLRASKSSGDGGLPLSRFMFGCIAARKPSKGLPAGLSVVASPPLACDCQPIGLVPVALCLLPFAFFPTFGGVLS